MSVPHDPVRQLTYLRQTLSQNNKPLGFFMSAGCPLAVQMPKEDWPLIPDIAGLTKFVADELKSTIGPPNKFDKLIDELKKAGKPNPNIEEILSFVRSLQDVSVGAENVRGLTEADLNALEKDICDRIIEKTKVELPSGVTPYHQLAQWIHLVDRDDCPVECFTTNYDLLLEQAFEDTGVTYFDGFVGSRRPFFDLRAVQECMIPDHWTRLWKIHGSINWFLDSNDNIYRATSLSEGDSSLIYPSHLKYDQSRKMPYLALIDRLNAFLRQPSAMLITLGYSFGDTHLNDTIISALKASPKAMVIAMLFGPYLDKEKKPRYERAFSYAKERLNLSAWASDQAVVGGQQGSWKISNLETLNDPGLAGAISQVVEAEGDAGQSDPAIRDQMNLGDFAVFGKFLQALIGAERSKSEDAK